MGTATSISFLSLYVYMLLLWIIMVDITYIYRDQ